jgi:hypothetical protein
MLFGESAREPARLIELMRRLMETMKSKSCPPTVPFLVTVMECCSTHTVTPDIVRQLYFLVQEYAPAPPPPPPPPRAHERARSQIRSVRFDQSQEVVLVHGTGHSAL